MKPSLALSLSCILCCLLVALPLQASKPHLDRDQYPSIQNPLPYIPTVQDGPAKAVTDTFTLIGPWGSGAPCNGQFQDVLGHPAWNDWTSHDLTLPQTEPNWHVSDYMEPDGSLALYCGDELIPSCGPDDPEGGYGNAWNDQIEYRYQVADPGADCAMAVSGVLSHATETGYDYLEMAFITAAGPVSAQFYDGEAEGILFEHEFLYQPTDYVGSGDDEVVFRLIFTSDGGYADTDCLYYGNGACRVDNILVECSNGNHSELSDFQDGTLGAWEIVPALGTGDFTNIWQGLEDLDPCLTNYSPQVAWIDDGNQVEGVGPTHCITWCYGPGGYIVNNTGGAVGEDAFLYNVVRSPVIEWDGAQLDGGVFAFDVYRHSNFGPGSPGIFHFWDIRSAASPEEIEEALWTSEGFIYEGGPDYVRQSYDASPHLVQGAGAVQVQVGVYEIGWIWGIAGYDGTPAPYFDNISLKVYDKVGPRFFTRSYELAQDNFPESGVLDLENLAANHVRFDMGRVEDFHSPVFTPGDSLAVRITPSRPGGEVTSARIHYTMDRNPLFDAVRDPAYGPSGSLEGYHRLNSFGEPYPEYFYFDLPDSGFLFPGDIIHYYFSATEEGEGLPAETGTHPSNLTGYGNFDAPLMYNGDFVMRALPSVSDVHGSQPSVLFWDDSSGHDDGNRWFWALRNLGMEEGRDYDRFVTKGASSNAGNGLGSLCTLDLLNGYEGLIYTAGDLSNGTLQDGSSSDEPSPDIPLLEGWLDGSEKDLLLMGDNLASGLINHHAYYEFVNDYMGVEVLTDDIRPYINAQSTPRVVAIDGNSVFYTTTAWFVDGGCPRYSQFDGLSALAGVERLAEFTSPAGTPSYPYAAAARNVLPSGSQVITLPYSLDSVADDPQNPVPYLHHRTALLWEILFSFGIQGGPVVPVPENGKFLLGNHPNPFNPATRIDFNLPRDGRIEVKVFNLRGELVRTLLDEERSAGAGHVMWDGKDGAGAQVGSGLYFCEARAAGEVKVQKMTLLK